MTDRLFDEQTLPYARDIMLEAAADRDPFARQAAVQELLNRLCASIATQETPAARWRADGKSDPTPQDYERAELPLAQYTDDELANAAYLCTGRIPEHVSNAAKQRMRWLSRRLCEAEAKLAAMTAHQQEG